MPIVGLQHRLEAYLRNTPRWGSSAVDGLTEVGQGWESVIHSFTVDGERLVLRRYAGPDGAAKAEREFDGMRLLREADYPVPEVLVLEQDPLQLGAPFILMRYVEGDGLWMQIFEPEGPNQDLLELFVELFVRLHMLDWKPFTQSPVNAPVKQELATWRQVIDTQPVRGFTEAMAWLQDRVDTLPPVEPAVVHWDFHPDNVLYSPDAGPSIVDWTQVGVTDPRFDLAWSMLLVSSVEGVEWRRRLRRLYEDLRGNELPAMEFFEAAVAAKRMYSVAVSLTAGPEVLGMRADAIGAIEAQLGVMIPVYEQFCDQTGLTIPGVEELLSR